MLLQTQCSKYQGISVNQQTEKGDLLYHNKANIQHYLFRPSYALYVFTPLQLGFPCRRPDKLIMRNTKKKKLNINVFRRHVTCEQRSSNGGELPVQFWFALVDQFASLSSSLY